MKLGILYAMEKEAAGLISGAPERVAGMAFYPLGPHVLCVGGVGKVNAAMAAQVLIHRFGVDRVLNAGCAGALTGLPVGTVVMADHCVQHDVDTSLAGDPVGLVSTVNCIRFPCLVPEGLPYPTAVVATGDWFGRDFPRAEDIRRRWGADVCDMEACAAAQVCLRNGVPFLALKSVSDHLLSPDQGAEYAANLPRAMESLDRAVRAVIKRMEG